MTTKFFTKRITEDVTIRYQHSTYKQVKAVAHLHRTRIRIFDGEEIIRITIKGKPESLEGWKEEILGDSEK